MQAQLAERFISYQEYLVLDEASSFKLEYWNGRVFPKDGATTAMAGGTPRHADLILNVSVAFGSRLRGKLCRGSSGEQRILVEATHTSYYPDFVVKCPPEKYSEQDKNALVDPALIVEVLSPGSEKNDRGEKFEQYSLIPELRDYILVSQDRVLVEHFARGDGATWVLQRFHAREDVLQLPHLEIEVPLEEIYDGLDVPSGLVLLRA